MLIWFFLPSTQFFSAVLPWMLTTSSVSVLGANKNFGKIALNANNLFALLISHAILAQFLLCLLLLLHHLLLPLFLRVNLKRRNNDLIGLIEKSKSWRQVQREKKVTSSALSWLPKNDQTKTLHQNRLLIPTSGVTYQKHHHAESSSESDADSASSLSPLPKTRAVRGSLHDCFTKISGTNTWQCTLPTTSTKVRGRTHQSCSEFTLKNGWRHLSSWHPDLFLKLKDPNRTIPSPKLVEIYKKRSQESGHNFRFLSS